MKLQHFKIKMELLLFAHTLILIIFFPLLIDIIAKFEMYSLNTNNDLIYGNLVF